MNITLKFHRNPLTSKDIDQQDYVALIAPEDQAADFPYAALLDQRSRKAACNAGTVLTTDLPNQAGTRVAYVRCKADISSFELLTLARKLTSSLIASRPASIAVYAPGTAAAFKARIHEAMVAALLAAGHTLPSYKSGKKTPDQRLNSIQLYDCREKPDLRRTEAEAAGNNLARDLTALPPNELTPALYRKRIASLAREHGWRMRFYDLKTLKSKKAGAFLAVAQGSAAQDDGIVHLRYTPKTGSKRAALALVGKGICFDTGGHNLKSAKHMYGMHEDMAGSAVALGTLLALSKLQVDFPVDCWLALAQNMISPRAYKQNDVVTALNGTTIEVVHTDAEGRMVLADTLALASRARPAFIIDYATLTGTCVYSLGTSYSGAFTNRRELLHTIIDSGTDSGERVWPFPTDSDYDQALDSDIADVKQCTMEGEADHILAARFLSRFVDEKIPWLHLDLSSASHKGGLAHIPTSTTGFGVRYTLNLVLDKNILTVMRGPENKNKRSRT